MEVFVTLLGKLSPIYIVIGLGYLITKKFNIDKDSIVKLLIYLIAPVVIFNGVYTLDLNAKLLLLPVMFFCISSFLALSVYALNKNEEDSRMRGILAFAAGSANTGYFGLPVAIAIFGESIIGLAVLSTFGLIMYENTVGFFLAAKSDHTARDALKKLLALPMLYAFILAIVFNKLEINLGSIYLDFVPNFRGAYVVLGSFVVGCVLAGFRRSHIDVSAAIKAYSVKFVVWPFIVVSLIQLDKAYWHIYTNQTDLYGVVFLMSIVPLAANTVAYATLLKTEPEKTAFMVFLSTIIALIYIPLLVATILPKL